MFLQSCAPQTQLDTQWVISPVIKDRNNYPKICLVFAIFSTASAYSTCTDLQASKKFTHHQLLYATVGPTMPL